MGKPQLVCLAGVVGLAVSSTAALAQPESGRSFGGGLTLTQPFGGANRNNMTVRPWVYGESGGGSGSFGSDSSEAVNVFLIMQRICFAEKIDA